MSTRKACGRCMAVAAVSTLSIGPWQTGMVLTEYLVGTLFVAMALFSPVPGLDQSAFIYLLDALRGFQANTTYLMSMP
ncbi:MAG: hypothetical protein AB8B87_18020 [Granulosicoccus sp.]